ncbi:MAG TPA: ankyrin repeat domain-containing protein [Stellaceae bacterium]|nr:ankyrin repeat domain-containing protein [Stellaceae bacterium]
MRRGGFAAAILSAAAAPARADISSMLNPFAEYQKNIPRAVLANDVGKIRTLLSDGYSPNQTDENGSTGLHVAAGTGNLQIIAILFKAGADINQKDAVGSTPLDYAAEHDRLDAAKLLLDMKANVNIQNKNGMTPLMFAARSGDVEMVRAMLAQGASATLSDFTGRDALGWALESHRPMVVQMLKDAQRKH